MAIDIELLRQKIGYPKTESVPWPRMPDSYYLEILERTEAKVRPFLIKYAKLVYDTGEVIEIDTAKIEKWRDDFIITLHANESGITGKALRYIRALDVILQYERYRHAPTELVRWIYWTLESTDKRIYLYSNEDEYVST